LKGFEMVDFLIGLAFGLFTGTLLALLIRWKNKVVLLLPLLLCLPSGQTQAQDLAGNYIGPAPWFFAPTVIRDPNLHRPTVTYPQPKCNPGVNITINNTNTNTGYREDLQPVVTNPYWTAPITGPGIKVYFGKPPAAPPTKPVINRYRG
jgi:hypothetical protein